MEPLISLKITPFENTTIGVVATNARLTKANVFLLVKSAHDGFAKAIFPAHTQGDGDAIVVAATGTVEASLGTVRLLQLSQLKKPYEVSEKSHSPNRNPTFVWRRS